MSTNLSTTVLPENFLTLDGVTIEMRDRALHEIPTASILYFYADRSRDAGPTASKILTGKTASQVADAINALPKNFHDDGQAAVPGRARNLVTSAIEDGWLVTITVRYRDVLVEFSQPTTTIQTLLRDLVARVNHAEEAGDQSQRRNRNQKYTARYLTQGLARYGWDYDAEAMRMDDLQDRRLTLSRVYDSTGQGQDLPHRSVTIERHADNDPSWGDRLTWRDFTGMVHDHCSDHVLAAMVRDQQSKDAKAAADAAFDGEAATPLRDGLRTQLAGIQAAAEGRRDMLAQAEMPALRQFRPERGGSGADTMLRRAAKYEAEGEVVSTVKGLLADEGRWEGDRRLHIDELLVRTFTKLTERLLDITTSDVVVSSADRQQDVYSTGHVIHTLAPLVHFRMEVVV